MTDSLDITVPISPDMLIYPGDPPVQIEPHTSAQGSSSLTVSQVHLGTHTGTHVDAPAHFGRAGTADRLPLHALIGPARVLDLRGTLEVGARALEAAGGAGAARILLKTDNSGWIRRGPLPDHPASLTRGGAEWIAEHGVLLVGIDGLSVDAPDATAAHEILLEAGVVILETVDLSEAEPGCYELLCLPLRIAADGAPARALLWRG